MFARDGLRTISFSIHLIICYRGWCWERCLRKLWGERPWDRRGSLHFGDLRRSSAELLDGAGSFPFCICGHRRRFGWRKRGATPTFIETYELKYEKAADCLKKDRDALLAYYDFPDEHWKHLRTSNPITSTFATVRHRTIRSKGCLSNKTALAMIFKLVEGAKKSWRRLDGHSQLPKIIQGVKLIDGLEIAANLKALQAKCTAA